MSKIILLSRVSSTPQQIEPQTNELIQYALHLGYDKDDMIIIETVESAIKLSEEERLGLQKMKHSIETSDVDCVICWEPSRLARQQKTLYSIRDYLVEKRIQLIILHPETKLLDKDGKVNPSANIVFSLFATISENEMMMKNERFKRAKNELRKQGKKFAGAVVFGYMKDETKACIAHPLYSRMIVEIFDHYCTTDDSMYETYMWASGRWPETFPLLEYIRAQHKILHMFSNELYVNGNWCYPKLVSQETWDKVHDKMSRARCKPRYKNNRPLLCRGKIYCAECGHMMTPSGGNTHAYICPTDKKHRLQISFDIADFIMWEETRSLININAAIDSRQKIHELEDMVKMKTNLIQQLELKIQENEQQMNKLLDVYMKGIIQIEQFEKKMEELKGVKVTLNNEMNEQKVTLEELRIALNENQNDIMKPTYVNVDLINDFEARLEFVRKYISKMIVEKSESEYRTFYITFEYTRPLIAIRSTYKYVPMNQKNKHVWRINEDKTEDLIL